MLQINERLIESNIRVCEAVKMTALEGIQEIMDRDSKTGDFDVDLCLDLLVRIDQAQKTRRSSRIVLLVEQLKKASVMED